MMLRPLLLEALQRVRQANLRKAVLSGALAGAFLGSWMILGVAVMTVLVPEMLEFSLRSWHIVRLAGLSLLLGYILLIMQMRSADRSLWAGVRSWLLFLPIIGFGLSMDGPAAPHSVAISMLLAAGILPAAVGLAAHRTSRNLFDTSMGAEGFEPPTSCL
jgi:hypothetical protein